MVYEVGRREPFLDHKKKAKDGKPGVSLDWFNMLYQVLLGQEKGPRFGSFVAVYGVQNTVDMIDGALARIGVIPPRLRGGWRAERAGWGLARNKFRPHPASSLRSEPPSPFRGGIRAHENISTLPLSAIKPSSTLSFGCFSPTWLLNSINAALCVSVSIFGLATAASP